MRIPHSTDHRRPRGATMVVTAITLPVLLGITALAVDVAVIGTTRAQLETAADAASLAGAARLVSENRLRGTSSLDAEMTAARADALTFAAANRVLNDPAAIRDNASNDPGGDVVVGYLNTAVPASTLQTDTASTSLFNSVQVTTSRTQDYGGLVPSYFSKLLGNPGSSLRVQATATVQNYAVVGYKTGTGPLSGNARLLPITLDLPTYTLMLSHATGDKYGYDPATGGVNQAPDGIHESVLYPITNGSGNLGTVNIGVDSNSTANLGNQIRNGITPAQLARYGGTLRLSPTTGTLNLTGDPGVSAGIKDDLASIIGQAVTIPIYDPALTSGTGNGQNYTIVAFAAVRIMEVNFAGNPKLVIIQPALIDDSKAIAGAPQPDWTSGGVVRLHLSR